MTVVAKADIGRSRRIGGSRWKLERAVPAGYACKPENVLLDLEVAGIEWGTLLAEWPLEAHGERPTERDPEADPGLERSAGTQATLDLA